MESPTHQESKPKGLSKLIHTTNKNKIKGNLESKSLKLHPSRYPVTIQIMPYTAPNASGRVSNQYHQDLIKFVNFVSNQLNKEIIFNQNKPNTVTPVILRDA